MMFGGSFGNMPVLAKDGEKRKTPPKATQDSLPVQVSIKPAKIRLINDDRLIVKFIRDNFSFGAIPELDDETLRIVNISSTIDLPLEQVIESQYVPAVRWLRSPQDEPTFTWQSNVQPHQALLLNGSKRPGHHVFDGFATELRHDLKDVYHTIRRDPPRDGFHTVNIKQFRKFWIALNTVGTYWDTSLDNESVSEEAGEKTTVGDSTVDYEQNLSGGHERSESEMSVVIDDVMDVDDENEEWEDEDEDEEALHPLTTNPQDFTYTGRRSYTGSQMEADISLDMASEFLSPILYSFGCYIDQHPASEQRLHIVDSQAHCKWTKLIYSIPKEKDLAKQGVMDGPVAVICAEAGEWTESNGLYPFMNELKGMLLCAQQRSREGKLAFHPGHGEWWGRTKEKWGGARDNGVGGRAGEAIGEPLTDLDLFPEVSAGSKVATSMYSNAEQNAEGHKGMNVSLWNGTYEETDATAVDATPTSSSLERQEERNKRIKDYLSQPLHDQKQSHAMESTSATESASLPNHSHSTKEVQDMTNSDSSMVVDNQMDIDTPDHSITSVESTESMESDIQRGGKSLFAPTTVKASIRALNIINMPTNHPDYRATVDEWYKKNLRAERLRAVTEQKKRATLIGRGHCPGRVILPGTKNRRYRLGVLPSSDHDHIHMISVHNQHISFVHLRIHFNLVDWLSPNPKERVRVAALPKDSATWWAVPVRRSRWYNLLDAEDRVEALRGAWAVCSRMMADVDSDAWANAVERDRMYGAGDMA